MVLNIALLGAGRIGQVHAKAVGGNLLARLVAVADAMPGAAEKLAAGYGARVATIDEIAAASDVDAVIICTPTDTHADLIEQFAKAGKAIFCEKPVDLSLDRVRACLEVAKDARLMVGFNRRFDPHFMAVRQAIADGRIGKVEMVTITSRDPGLPPLDYLPRSGGVFRDMTIHDLDMARFLLGAEIATVQASASVLVDSRVADAGDYDSASLILTTAAGQQCVISNSRRATYGYDQRIEVLGSDGMIAAENQRPVDIQIANAEGFTRPPLHDFFMTRYVAAYAAEIAAFVAMAQGQAVASPNGHDGMIALALAEAAIRSVAEGRRVDMSEFGL